MAVKRYKGAKEKATKLHSEIIRMHGMCEHCGGSDWLQCAHIISRRYNATRTDLRNAFCLDAKCHRYFTDYPREFSRFITDTWAAKYYDYIFANSRTPVRHYDWEARVEFLKAAKEALTKGEMTITELRESEQEL